MKIFKKYNMNKVKRGLTKSKYLKIYKKTKIEENKILLESKHGKDINGNIFYLLQELNKNLKFKNFDVYLAVNKKNHSKIKCVLENYNLKCNFVYVDSAEYYEVISSAKYLINDTTFSSFFIKKEGQVYLNTWHGTPLKTLGRSMNSDYHNIGNVQKNFIISDYILFQNEFTMKKFVSDYMFEHLTSAKYILGEYPRNEGLTNNNIDSIKRELNVENKKIYAYMPTWRGVVSKADYKSDIYLQYHLYEIDNLLTDDELMYVNVHPIASKNIDFSTFSKIKPFPSNYETYDFLKVSNVLITDYSSVMFDYLHTNKKCVLFTYDKEEYFKDRGLYIELEELPFKQCNDIKTLLKEIRNPEYTYEKTFNRKIIPYKTDNASKQILEHIILRKKSKFNIVSPEPNKKENVLIYVGNLAKNGITTSILNLVSNIDLNKRNYFLTFSAKSVSQYAPVLKTLPKKINYISIQGQTNLNLFQKIIMKLYDKNKIKFKFLFNILKKSYAYDVQRIYGKSNFSHVIHFTGYEYKKLILFSQMNCKKTVYVHTNKVEEIRIRKVKPAQLNIIFNKYDKIACVTPDMIESTKKLMYKKDYNKIFVVPNIIDYKKIEDNSKKDIIFDDDTECNVSLRKLIVILNKKNKKFINIGRFSKEKGHIRLINAFNKIWLKDNNIYLIIIGGYGKAYQEVLAYVKNIESKNNIVVIKSISNPFPILKKCDYFVLSSFYEGFGLVLAEADILSIPVISTNILGPQKFMLKHNGHLVTDNEEGIYNGMLDMLENKIKVMNVNYEKYNEDAIEQFENLF